MRQIDISGKRFGKWLVESYSGNGRWSCVCDCGTRRTVVSWTLRVGDSTSCGCERDMEIGNRFRKHGCTGTREYIVWRGMISRCNEVSSVSYPRYGGRGITVCDRWLKFENFLADMGRRPDGMSLERINNDGNYCLENCRWATPVDQARNTRTNTIWTVGGVARCVAAWSEETGLSSAMLFARVYRHGWTPEQAVSIPRYGRIR